MEEESNRATSIDRQESEGFDLPQEPGPEVSPSGTTPLQPSEIIRLPTRHNPTLQKLVGIVNSDEDLHAIWRCQNVNGVDRLGMSDHGPVHVQIVANLALRLLRLLMAKNIQPSIVKDHGMSEHDAEVVVVLAALLHDCGMSIHRDDHEFMSLFIALPKLQELLSNLYSAAERRVIISETLHAIITHRSDGRPLTLEAGIVRVADALDMAQGRSRIPFESGHVNIHSVSAAAIEKVEINQGQEKAIRVTIYMSNAAGIFQIDELLRQKLKGSGLETHVEVVAQVTGESDKRLVETFKF
ncbi:metal dependent phosphohydrolase [Thermobaculum terrenum ATCC BAA-798]|uniref:Metal dependent phosphohydrolase n=1 Tax=Thermobaculum terrenum (strain ATCC BAA-798 / CCMEE 7001 / YNP1) TaxID=525904 RepID=D1CEW3_THET1|nr:HD domain-containing protein [Thermobaculum terrenum]ACZ41469.1 metal dependent phosphohydrolase [Thermobaculum terrenum ATCC BAA-798]